MEAVCILSFCYAFMFESGYTDRQMDLRIDTCVDVATSAERHSVDPALAIAVSHVESGFQRKAVSSAGARGPMQVMTRFWCKSKSCNLIDAGMRALKTYTEKSGTRDGLCQYFSGKVCKRSRQRKRYRDKVLRFADRASLIYSETCIYGC